jgi:hypothetical protein
MTKFISIDRAAISVFVVFVVVSMGSGSGGLTVSAAGHVLGVICIVAVAKAVSLYNGSPKLKYTLFGKKTIFLKNNSLNYMTCIRKRTDNLMSTRIIIKFTL